MYALALEPGKNYLLNDKISFHHGTVNCLSEKILTTTDNALQCWLAVDFAALSVVVNDSRGDIGCFS